MSGDNHSSTLPLQVAVPLATAVAVHVATSVGVRVLVIKGVSAEVHGLRQPRVSADVDVLVDPAGFGEVLGALSRAGWQPRPMYGVSAHLEPHSESLVHRQWPCDIDLHRRFPGFLASPQETFEALWEQRENVSVAGCEVAIPGREGAILVGALHAVRTVDGAERLRTEWDQIVHVIAGLSGKERDSLVALAHRTGASGPLASTFARAGIAIDVPDSPELRAWNARRLAGPVFAGNLVAGLRGKSWRERAQLLRLALWPSADELRAVDPTLGDSRRAMVVVRARRWGRGLVQLPRAIAASRRADAGRAEP